MDPTLDVRIKMSYVGIPLFHAKFGVKVVKNDPSTE
jgi:hypothetical protein